MILRKKKWDWKNWDRNLLLQQQEIFFQKLQNYGVELFEVQSEPDLMHQMYTRDTAFVVDDTLYYSKQRTLKSRHGEIEKLFEKISPDRTGVLSGRIEGGDVLVGKTTLVGISNRTEKKAFDQLAQRISAKSLFIGESVMHLDMRMTLLPNKYILVYMEAFTSEDQQYLKKSFNIIPVTKSETAQLGSNVFVVNPETIFVEEKQQRIQDELKKAGFRIESLAYSEPIALGGSFRCTTLPLIREN